MRVLHVVPGTAEGPTFIFAKRQIADLSSRGVDNETYYLGSRTDPVEIAQAWREVRARIADFDPDLIHAHYGTVTAAFSALLSRRPLVITYQGSDVQGSMDVHPLRTQTSTMLSQLAAPRATAHIYVSEPIRDRIKVKPSITAVVPTGVDLDVFRPIPRDEARAHVGWDHDHPMVLFNAGKRPRLKRLDLAEDGVAHARKTLPDLGLHVLHGNTPASEIPWLMNAVDIVLLCSEREGTPNVVKEALACNTPVISVDVGDVKHRIRGVDNARLVPYSANAIGDAIVERIQAGPGEGGREVVSELSSDRIVDKVLDVYEQVLSAG